MHSSVMIKNSKNLWEASIQSFPKWYHIPSVIIFAIHICTMALIKRNTIWKILFIRPFFRKGSPNAYYLSLLELELCLVLYSNSFLLFLLLKKYFCKLHVLILNIK